MGEVTSSFTLPFSRLGSWRAEQAAGAGPAGGAPMGRAARGLWGCRDDSASGDNVLFVSAQSERGSLPVTVTRL